MNKTTPVSEIMTRNVVFVNKNDTIEVIEEKFKDKKIRHLPVLDDENKVKGIISKEDYLKYLKYLSKETSGESWTEIQNKYFTAEDIMSDSPTVVNKDVTLQLAAGIFTSFRIHCLPVMDNQAMVGILTPYDLVSYAFEN